MTNWSKVAVVVTAKGPKMAKVIGESR
jgi:hypothetical protein